MKQAIIEQLYLLIIKVQVLEKELHGSLDKQFCEDANRHLENAIKNLKNITDQGA